MRKRCWSCSSAAGAWSRKRVKYSDPEGRRTQRLLALFFAGFFFGEAFLTGLATTFLAAFCGRAFLAVF